MKLLDTTFLIDLLKGKEETLKIINCKEILLTTQINMYEVIRGLFIRRVQESKISDTIETFDNIRVLSLDNRSIIKSAEISAELMKKGIVISDCDCITAGIALSNGVDTIVTRNVKHFERIKDINVEIY